MVSGFAHAPITKGKSFSESRSALGRLSLIESAPPASPPPFPPAGLIILTTLATLITSVFQYKPYTHLQLVPHIFVYAQYWRFAAHHVAFTNASELFLAVLLFYSAGREVERRFGSSKYAAFLVVTTLLHTVLLFLLLTICVTLPNTWFSRALVPRPLRTDGRIPSGPFGPLFALIYQHARIVPDQWLLRLGSVYLGDRAVQIWSLALLLFLSQPSTTPFVCLVAFATSALYRSDLLLSSSLKSYRLPSPLYALLAFLLSGLVGSTRTPTRSWRAEPPAPPSFERREARRNQVREAINGARDERVRRTSAVLQSVGRVRRRFQPGAAARDSGSDRNALLPISSTTAAADDHPARLQELQRADEMLRSLLQNALRSAPTPTTRNPDPIGPPSTSTRPTNDASDPAAIPNDEPDPPPNLGSVTALQHLITQITGIPQPPAITESAIQALQAMFPHIPRNRLVEALQMSNGSQPDAVERLLLEPGSLDR